MNIEIAQIEEALNKIPGYGELSEEVKSAVFMIAKGFGDDSLKILIDLADLKLAQGFIGQNKLEVDLAVPRLV